MLCRRFFHMKLLWQFLLILFISFAGEILHAVIPLPIPASIYGLVILFACLKTGLVKLKTVDEAGGFFIETMPVLFVAPGVAILGALPVFRQYWWQFLIIAVVSTILVFIVSGHVTQLIIRLSAKNEKSESAKEKSK